MFFSGSPDSHRRFPYFSSFLGSRGREGHRPMDPPWLIQAWNEPVPKRSWGGVSLSGPRPFRPAQGFPQAFTFLSLAFICIFTCFLRIRHNSREHEFLQSFTHVLLRIRRNPREYFFIFTSSPPAFVCDTCFSQDPAKCTVK